jgi:hypothetical protein
VPLVGASNGPCGEGAASGWIRGPAIRAKRPPARITNNVLVVEGPLCPHCWTLNPPQKKPANVFRNIVVPSHTWVKYLSSTYTRRVDAGGLTTQHACQAMSVPSLKVRASKWRDLRSARTVVATESAITIPALPHVHEHKPNQEVSEEYAAKSFTVAI